MRGKKKQGDGKAQAGGDGQGGEEERVSPWKDSLFPAFFLFVTVSLKAQQLAQLVSKFVDTFPLFCSRLSIKMKPGHRERILLSDLLPVKVEERIL